VRVEEEEACPWAIILGEEMESSTFVNTRRCLGPEGRWHNTMTRKINPKASPHHSFVHVQGEMSVKSRPLN